MQRLLIATRNKGKFPEIVEKLKGLPFEFLNLNDIENIPKDFEVEETGETFEENAVLKARTLAEMSGLLTLADDAGLCVDALDGRPGVYTERYAPGTDEDRYMKLLGELEGVSDRRARFVAVVAIYDPKTGLLKTCKGIYEGEIVREPIGENGFGYDPVFYNPILGKTNAQLSLEEKNNVSHRGKALQKTIEILLREFS